MTEPTVFNKKHTEEVTEAEMTLLDELNLSAEATTFIREKKVILISIFFLIIFSILGYRYYNYYTTNLKNNSSKALAQAEDISDQKQKNLALAAVSQDYARSGAATWAKISQAMTYFEKKEYPKSITIFQELIAKSSKNDPLLPLLKQQLALSFEMAGQNEKALPLYTELTEISSFAGPGFLAIGRIYEKLKNPLKAKEAYENANTKKLNDEQKSWLKSKIDN